MENQISFIPNRTSSSTSRMDPNQSDDPNTGSDTDKENQRLYLHQKCHQIHIVQSKEISEMTRKQSLTKIRPIKVHLHQKDH